MNALQGNQACLALHLEPPSHFLEQLSPVVTRSKLYIFKSMKEDNVGKIHSNI